MATPNQNSLNDVLNLLKSRRCEVSDANLSPAERDQFLQETRFQNKHIYFQLTDQIRSQTLTCVRAESESFTVHCRCDERLFSRNSKGIKHLWHPLITMGWLLPVQHTCTSLFKPAGWILEITQTLLTDWQKTLMLWSVSQRCVFTASMAKAYCSFEIISRFTFTWCVRVFLSQ